MMQNTQARSRTGWAPEETQMMWEAVKQAGSSGNTLKSAFVSVAERTGRKPDSIRNYYYQSLKVDDAPAELAALRSKPFIPFESQDVDWLLREILVARSQGMSVRACVHRMGGGDKAQALRYQNKYRSILKNRPDMIQSALEKLREEGIDCPSPYDSIRSIAPRGQRVSGGEAEALLRAMRDMLSRQEREENVRHREELDRMSVRCDLLRLELARRDEQLVLAKENQMHTAEQLQKASGMMEACRELLSAQDIEKALEQLTQAMQTLQA